jgi:hypothetical protein
MRVSLPRFLLLATSVFLFVGLGALAAWEITGRAECVSAYFHGPGALCLVTLAFFEFSLARLVVRQFSPGETLHPAWFLIMVSAGCHLAGSFCVQILSVDSVLNPLTYSMRAWFALNQESLRRFGLIVGGPLQMVFLAAGLSYVVRLCLHSRIKARFRWPDWILLLLAAVPAYSEILRLVMAARAGQDITPYEMLAVSTSPLLVLLLIEAGFVRHFIAVMNGGLIARCWSAFVAAIFLTTLENFAVWMTNYNHVPGSLAATSWYICFLSATAFALGPAWQVEAIQSACGEVGAARFSPFASSLAALRLINTKASGN